MNPAHGLGLAALALLASCNGGLSSYNPDGDTSVDDSDADTDADSDSDTDTDTDTDADADLDPLAVDDVDPAWGSNGGGGTVTISGGPFDDSAEVFFVGASKTVQATVQLTSSSEVVATVPASDDVGNVDVKVVTDTRAGTATGAYTYWEDGSGKIGVIGSIEWYKYVGSYWSGTPVDFGSAAMMFVEPTTETYRTLYYARSLDRCESDYAGPATSVYAYEIGADNVRLTIPTTSNVLTLTKNASYAYYYELADKDGDTYANDLKASDYKQNAAYGLQPISSTSFPAFEIETMVKTPDLLQVTAPAITGSTVPTVPRNFTFSWSTGTPGDYMVVTMYRYDASGVAEVVTCAMNDDGSFQVPNSVWAGWDVDEQITILIGRAVEAGDTLPHNNTDGGVVGVYWVIGAAFQQ